MYIRALINNNITICYNLHNYYAFKLYKFTCLENSSTGKGDQFQQKLCGVWTRMEDSLELSQSI